MGQDDKARILLVEDDIETCRMYETILEKSGFEVEVAFDGKEALAKISVGGYDVVVLDVRLPKMSGLEVLEELEKRPPLKSSGPIVMLTNVGEEKVVRKAMSLGALSYMNKADLEPRELVERVKGVLGRGEGVVKTGKRV